MITGSSAATSTRSVAARKAVESATFDVALVDARMPGDGLALLEQLEAMPSLAGRTALMTGDLGRAQQALEEAVRLDPTFAKAFHLLGRVFDRMHRPSEAIEMYRRAREIASQ